MGPPGRLLILGRRQCPTPAGYETHFDRLWSYGQSDPSYRFTALPGLATTRATRDRHRFCRSHPLRRSPRPMRPARVRQVLRHTSTVPEATRIGKVVPTRGNHLDHAAGGDIATARRHEALYSHGSTPHRRRVALLRDLLMIPRP